MVATLIRGKSGRPNDRTFIAACADGSKGFNLVLRVNKVRRPYGLFPQRAADKEAFRRSFIVLLCPATLRSQYLETR
jgi:hypothetical protein